MNHTLIESLSSSPDFISHLSTKGWRIPQKTLMVSPDFFRIEYSINPYMKDSNGQLKKVDLPNAVQQWNSLKTKFQELSSEVSVIAGDPKLPDMVFAANQSLVFWMNDKPNVLLSNMRAPERRPEVAHFENWFRSKGYTVHKFETPEVFCEGNGDVLLDQEYKLLWGGVGPRTNRDAYKEISARFEIPVILLNLVAKEFYHLDTCFSIINKDTVAIQKSAFDEQGLKLINARFKNVIEISLAENLNSFAGNCHSPNGRDVVLQQGSNEFCKNLQKLGLKTHEVDTREFIKSGGSVFCMKMMVF